MTKLCRVFLSAALPALAAFLFTAAVPSARAATADGADAFFGLTNVWTFHLKVSAEDWAAMPPAAPARMGGAGGGPMIHYDFKSVPATLEHDGKTYSKIGLRFKGNSSYMMTQNSMKRPFKIDFNEYVPGQKFLGLTKLSLNNNEMDATQMREALGYQFFRDAGVAASRTAFARLYLTVPGKYDRQYAGLYTIVENVDSAFLKKQFGDKHGALLKPEARGGLPYYGEAWSAYEKPYEPKTEVTPEESKQFIALTKLVTQGSDSDFRAQIGSYLDVTQFLKFLAVNTATANLDSFLTMGHNLYLHTVPKTKKTVWIPWDLNHDFGSFSLVGTPQQHIDLSIDHPHAGENKLIERMLAIPENKTFYHAELEKHAATLQGEKLKTSIAALVRVLRPALTNDPQTTPDQFDAAVLSSATNRAWSTAPPPRRGFGAMGMNWNSGPPLQTWIVARAESILEQLRGKRAGKEPQSFMGGMGGGGRGGPGGPGGAPAAGAGAGAAADGFGPGTFLAPEMFAGADANKDGKLTRDEFKKLAAKWFTQWDQKKSGALSGADVVDGLNSTLVPDGGGAPGGFGPGTFMGPQIFTAADANKDKSVSKEELTGLFDTWYTQWDTEKTGSLDEASIRRGLNKVIGPPAGFGGPPDF